MPVTAMARATNRATATPANYQKELAHVKHKICASEHGSLNPGDTIEVHYVHSSAQVMPGQPSPPV